MREGSALGVSVLHYFDVINSVIQCSVYGGHYASFNQCTSAQLSPWLQVLILNTIATILLH